jgi:hypothetical protein
MISSLIKDSSDGLDAVLVQMIEEITYKAPKSDHKLSWGVSRNRPFHTEKKSCGTKPKKGFVHAAKLLQKKQELFFEGFVVLYEILTNTYQVPNKLFEGFVVLYETKKGFRFRCKLINLLMVS